MHLSFALALYTYLPLLCKCEFSLCLRVCVRDRCDEESIYPSEKFGCMLVWMRGWCRVFVFPGLSLKERKPHDENIRSSTEHTRTGAHTQITKCHKTQHKIYLARSHFIFYIWCRVVFGTRSFIHSFMHSFLLIHARVRVFLCMVRILSIVVVAAVLYFFFNAHILSWLHLLRVIYINSDKLFRPHTNIRTIYTTTKNFCP